jgi:branched-chain amino acid transport system ATP-binding protein
MLTVRELSVSYGVIPVLHRINMNIEEGQIVALLGGNGSGKTTLLNTISGFINCTSGSINYLKHRIDGLPPHKIVELGIVQIPEGRHIFPHLSVKENLLMGACSFHKWKERYNLLEMVYRLFPRLKERSNQRTNSLSGGEQQMLVIARGLMAQPKLLMVDEPSLGLAPVVLSQIYDVLRSLPEMGITILLSEQNVQFALEIADRGYVLQDGRIVLEGRSSDLLKNRLIKKTYLGV